MDPLPEAIDTKEVREKLANGEASSWWRSFGEVLETPEFLKWAEDEFPERGTLLQIDRRDFLKLAGATALMASLAGCRRLDKDEIVPFVHMPEGRVPGKTLQYATSFVHDGFAIGVLAVSSEGRPIKIEGNPLHPSSMGRTDAFTQASIYHLYDPFRSQEVVSGRMAATLEEFVKAFQEAMKECKKSRRDVAVLTGSVTSPSLAGQIARLQKRHPGLRWVSYQPWNRDNVYEGTRLAFEERLSPVYHFVQADVVVSLDGDFLARTPGNIRYAADFGARRHIEGMDASKMNRLYAVESAPSITGAMADHRKAVKASEVEPVARALANLLGLSVPEGAKPAVDEAWLRAAAADLQAHRGKCLLIAGEHQPPIVHALVHAMNHTLGAVGATVEYTAPPESGAGQQLRSLKNLTADMSAGRVGALLILGENPVYDAPADLEFAEALRKVSCSAHLGLFRDETGETCAWHLPESHFLEAWGDARAFDGTVSLQQPLIAPLYSTVSAIELIEKLLDGTRTGRQILRDRWTTPGSADSQAAWDRKVHDGMIRDTAFASKPVTLGSEFRSVRASNGSSGLEAVILPDETVHDGRYANCPWLQELPKPMTSTVWDNAVYLSARTAERLGLKREDLATVAIGRREVTGSVWIQPGQADDLVVLHFGYGRVSGAPLALDDTQKERGFSAYAVQSSDAPFIAAGVEVRKAGGAYPIGDVQEHHVMRTSGGGRALDIVRSGTVAEFASNPSLSPDPEKDQKPLTSLYNDQEFEHEGNKWAMTVDLNLCIGCGACTLACQVENNIPAVGKSQCERGREMHWLRVDRYYKGSLDDPDETLFQPVPCMHCENAPCEPVCPVAATTHSTEGLNQMVYNRCVGTRYCSNNCPYKVRRFNFLNYADRKDQPTLQLLNNPNVSVRGRGIMEKCTYCVQRISAARIEAKKRGVPIQDGEIVTACQQACPTNAIVFGNMADAQSQVSRSRAQPRNYTLLRNLNTRPRTTYLSRVRNPNPEIEGAHGD